MLPEPPAATVLYASLDLPEAEAQRFEEAMLELPAWLAREPICASVSVAPMPTPWLNTVSEKLARAPNLAQALDDLPDFIMDPRSELPRLVLGCASKHEFAQKAVRCAPHALWGCACGRFALCYNFENPYSVWHETLHTLGAKDCYDLETRQTTCECAGCLMQYAATEQTIGDWPWLCDANQKRVRSLAERFVNANRQGDDTGG